MEQFRGTYPATLDDKGRLIISSRFRDRFGDGVVVMRGVDNCLYLLPPEVHEAKTQAAAEQPSGSYQARMVQRLLNWAHELEMDGQHRITLPQDLREALGLEREVVQAGTGDHVEIWDRRQHEAYMRRIHQAMQDFDGEFDL